MQIRALRGERVVLRGWAAADAEPFAALNADPVTMEHFPSTLTRAESDALIARAQSALETRGWGWWCLDIEGSCAGFVGLSIPGFEARFTPCVEIGWRMDRRRWGLGYATEAARLALDFGFNDLGLAELVSFTAVGNLRSQRVMQRLGMSRNPAEDFDHPRIRADSPLCRHVLYRLQNPSLASAEPV
jgi:ribosomal-protein-alanine N-acetyltransferase